MGAFLIQQLFHIARELLRAYLFAPPSHQGDAPGATLLAAM